MVFKPFLLCLATQWEVFPAAFLLTEALSLCSVSGSLHLTHLAVCLGKRGSLSLLWSSASGCSVMGTGWLSARRPLLCQEKSLKLWMLGVRCLYPSPSPCTGSTLKRKEQFRQSVARPEAHKDFIPHTAAPSWDYRGVCSKWHRTYWVKCWVVLGHSLGTNMGAGQPGRARRHPFRLLGTTSPLFPQSGYLARYPSLVKCSPGQD